MLAIPFRPWFRVVVGILALMGLAGTDAKHEEVQVTVVAILANSTSTSIDPKLTAIAKQVQKSEPQLTGFRLGRQTTHAVAVGSRHEFPLVDSQVLPVTIKHATDENNRIGVTVKPPKEGEIVYDSSSNKYFTIVTRYTTEDKDRLIISLMVEPTGNK